MVFTEADNVEAEIIRPGDLVECRRVEFAGGRPKIGGTHVVNDRQFHAGSFRVLLSRPQFIPPVGHLPRG